MSYVFIPIFIVLGISIIASLVAAKKESDFFLANRSIRWPLLVGTLVGTQVGGGFILGNSDASFTYGLFGSMYSLGLAGGLMLLGLGYASRLRKLNISTMPQLLQQRYQSPLLQKAGSLLSIFSLVGILMCMAIGIRKFLMAIDYDQPLFYLIIWASVVLYTTCGGLLAVVWTDFVQVLVIGFVLIISFLVIMLPKWPIILSQITSMPMNIEGITISSLLMPCCFIFVEQDMAQRCFAAKSPRDATISCMISAFVLIALTGIPTCFGILGRALQLSPANGAIFIQVLQTVAHPMIFMLAASAILLAIVSTASSVLLAASSNLAEDFMNSSTYGRSLTLIIGLLAGIGPYIGSDIVSGLVFSYEISVGALLIPLLFAVFTKKRFLPKEAAWTALISGTAGTIIGQYSTGIFWAFAPLIFSLVGYGIGYYSSLYIYRYKKVRA